MSEEIKTTEPSKVEAATDVEFQAMLEKSRQTPAYKNAMIAELGETVQGLIKERDELKRQLVEAKESLDQMTKQYLKDQLPEEMKSWEQVWNLRVEMDKQIKQLQSANAALRDVVKDFVDGHDIHDDADCPEDDTCKCWFAKKINAAMKGAQS